MDKLDIPYARIVPTRNSSSRNTMTPWSSHFLIVALATFMHGGKAKPQDKNHALLVTRVEEICHQPDNHATVELLCQVKDSKAVLEKASMMDFNQKSKRERLISTLRLLQLKSKLMKLKGLDSRPVNHLKKLNNAEMDHLVKCLKIVLKMFRAVKQSKI